MARSKRPVRSAVLFFLRTLLGVERKDLAEAARLKESTIEDFERGKNEPGLPALERLASALGVSEVLLEEVLALAEGVRDGSSSDVWVGPILVSAAQMRKAREFGEEMGRVARDSFRGWVLQDFVEAEAARERAIASEIGFYLRGRENLVEVVREDPGCHLWSVAEWLADESLKTAPRSWNRATELADAALAVAKLAPGEKHFKMRLEGFAWAHIGNARRVSGALRLADSAFAVCAELWAAGVGGDPHSVLDAGRVLGMEASLRRAQGRLTEAIQLIRTALSLASIELLPHLHINHAKVLEDMENYEQAIAALQEASRWMTSQTPLHLIFIQQKNLLVNLCHLGRHWEAERLLPEVWELGRDLGSESELVRLWWLQGRVDEGLGRLEEAQETLLRVQQEFRASGNVYDAALVALDRANLFLKRGETGMVKALVAEMAPVFNDEGVHLEAQKALRLFQEAAEREAVSRELVAQISKYLNRARRAPGLCFEPKRIA